MIQVHNIDLAHPEAPRIEMFIAPPLSARPTKEGGSRLVLAPGVFLDVSENPRTIQGAVYEYNVAVRREAIVEAGSRLDASR